MQLEKELADAKKEIRKLTEQLKKAQEAAAAAGAGAGAGAGEKAAT